MYGLLQSGIIASTLLKKWLTIHGYFEFKDTPGMWRHQFFPATFALVVDYFDVNFVEEEHTLHLKMTSNNITHCPWTGTGICIVELV